MSAAEEDHHSSVFTDVNPPLILDSDLDAELRDNDLSFFDAAVAHTSPTSASRIFDDFFSSSPAGRDLTESTASPTSVKHSLKEPLVQPHLNSSHLRQTYSGSSSNSPDTSSQGSPSGSPIRLNRAAPQKALPTNSNEASMSGHDSTMDWTTTHGMTNGDDSLFGLDDSALPPLDSMGDLSTDTDFTLSNQAMANDFDFESAGSSPTPFGLAMPSNTSVMSNPSTAMAFRSPGLDSPAGQTKSASPHVFYFQGSRENSPLAPMLPSQEESPNFWNNSSPSSSLEETFNGITMNGNSPQNPPMQANVGFNVNGFTHGMSDSSATPSTFGKDLSSPPSTVNSSENGVSPTLTLNHTPLKSRVETQIPIVMTLYPLPAGVTKLHLPTHTISKPKLLSKPIPDRSPDTLELYTSLVCTSAMQDGQKLSKAFARARGEEVPRSSDSGSRQSSEGSSNGEDDEDKPLNGADVKICQGCVLRERKRAARKKLKKVEEEESWQKDEEKRVIVFNTQEVKDWSEPSKENALGFGEHIPQGPPGAMYVTLPMRIACYCRHQNEKLGFQVIFTIKDHKDKVVAQQITNSIMITDDHKTHAPPQPMAPPSSALPDGTHLPGAGVFSSGPGPSMEMPSAPTLGPQPVRLSHSTTDLAGLQNNFNPQFPMVPQPFAMPQNVSTSTSSTLTPRNLSRQASPTGFSGPSTKRRKHSGSGKLPSGLTMTRIETGQPPQFGQHAGPATAPTSTATSPYPLPNMNMAGSTERQQYMNPMIPVAYNTSPPTPNSNDNSYFSAANRSQSMENLPLHQWLSAPSSAHPSRPGSPNASRSNLQDPAQFAQALNNQFFGGNSFNNTNNRPPIIHKLIPAEGSISGGTEVTLLGSGFYQGLEVCFGDSLATTTTYWGKKCLHCLTPPAIRPGTVTVMFKQDHPQFGQMQPNSPLGPKQQILFTYTDDREQEMMRLALNIVGSKMTGQSQDPVAFARQVITSQQPQWNMQMQGGSGQGGHQRPTYNSALSDQMDLETQLLRCLDLIDLDDSARIPRYDLKRPTGQTLLHYASSLGLTRFVAGLLARGADPNQLDNNGLTPMHFAAMSGHTGIVRRLRLAGADHTIRSLRNYTPSDLATSIGARQATLVSRHHIRSVSAGSTPIRSASRSTSAMSWGNDSTQSFDYSSDSSSESDSDDELPRLNPMARLQAAGTPQYTTPPRRGSAQIDVPKAASMPQTPSHDIAPGLLAPPAAMVAWRDHLAVQIQQFQQSVNWSLPNLPALPPMPTLPDYQTNPMMRRISSLVPHRAVAPRNPEARADSRWWDFLSSTSQTSAPPAYEDLFGSDESTEDYSVKKSSAMQAAADAALDQHFESMSSQASSSRTGHVMGDVKIGRKSISKESQDQLRMEHKQRVKKIRSDWNLFIIWIPLLVVVVVAMLRNLIPDVWHGVLEGYGFIKEQYQGRVFERVVEVI